MVNVIPLRNIEEEQKTDYDIVKKIGKIMQFLRNIEDWDFLLIGKRLDLFQKT